MEWIWFAAVIDCEGTIGVYKQGSKSRPMASVTPNLSVVNTNLAIIQKVAQIARTLGIQRDYKQYGTTKRNKPIYTWACRSRKELLQILPRISPHLVAKRPQAEALLHILENGPYWPKTPEWVIGLADKIREWNQKGNAEPDAFAGVGEEIRTPGLQDKA